MLESSTSQRQKAKKRDQESEGHMHVNVRCLLEVEFKSQPDNNWGDKYFFEPLKDCSSEKGGEAEGEMERKHHHKSGGSK